MKRVKLAELAWLAIVAPGSPSAVAEVGSVASGSLSSVLHNVSLSSRIVVDVGQSSLVGSISSRRITLYFVFPGSVSDRQL